MPKGQYQRIDGKHGRPKGSKNKPKPSLLEQEAEKQHVEVQGVQNAEEKTQ